MRKLICLLVAVLLLAALSVNAFADSTVQSMIEGLPTVEEFQAMDADAQLEAYNQTQMAYDAYMALSEAERSEISGGEEIFEALFSHFNTMIMPVEAVAAEVPAAPAAESSGRADLLTAGVALAVSVAALWVLNKKKQ